MPAARRSRPRWTATGRPTRSAPTGRASPIQIPRRRSARLAAAPTALFSSGADLSSATAGQQLNFQLPVANGSYTMTLYFADPSANAAGQRVFNIVANGQTLQANYDIFAAANTQFGDGNHAVSLSFNVTVAGGARPDARFRQRLGASSARWSTASRWSRRMPAAPPRPPRRSRCPPTAAQPGRTIASAVPINAYGQGQYIWTVNQTSNGNTALMRVLSSTGGTQPTAVTGTSQPFLLANGGNVFYVAPPTATYNPAAEQYTTAPGNDANSGKSPDQPVASLAALLRAYPIGPGDTIYVDAGSYTLPTDIILPAADSGSVAAPVLITGPTNGSLAIFNRNNTSAGTDVFDLLRHQQHRHSEPDDRGRL